MKERTLQVMADVNCVRLLNLIEDDIEDIAIQATDAEITRQFETIQKELEWILKNYIKDTIEGKL